MVESLVIIAFTHRTVGLADVAKLHIEEAAQADRLNYLKAFVGLDEVMLISTCNRVELIMKYNGEVNEAFLLQNFRTLYSYWDEDQLEWAISNATVFKGWNAVQHLFNVASSLDSLVIGEREIITQIREAFERSRDEQLSGDLIRVVIRKTIETAKQVFTDTEIANKPVSVVNLAYRALKQFGKIDGARILMIGAGVTNAAMLNNLKKHQPKSITIFNRTIEKAETLATQFGAKALTLTQLANHTQGFDVIISCTGANEPVINQAIFKQLLNGETDKKFIVDLALPTDIHADVVQENPVHYIDIESLKSIAEANMEERKSALGKCESIIQASIKEFEQISRIRQVEIAMGAVPEMIKEIKQTALQQVFARDVEKMDPASREILEKVMTYMEKKYISVPMKMAKEILVEGVK